MINWERVRSDFPITKKCVYFQSAGMSPMPLHVFNEIVSGYREILEYGDLYWLDDLKNYHSLKKNLAELINSSDQDIAMMPNTSYVMSFIADAVKKKRPGKVISMACEFPATTLPFEYKGLEMVYIKPEDNRYDVDRIAKLINKDTSAVLTSYVQYCTGFRQNLKALGQVCKEKKVLFIVNATQGLPFFPVDVKSMNIDALSASFHKWGLSGHVGSLFYTSEFFRNEFPQTMAGWLSIEHPEDDFVNTEKNVPFKLLKSADRYILGTTNLQSLNGLRCAINYLKDIGFKNIQQRILKLSDYLHKGLKKMEIEILSPVNCVEERSAITVVSVGENTRKLFEYLEKNKIYCAMRNKNLRISLNFFNNYNDIDYLIDSTEKFLNSIKN